VRFNIGDRVLRPHADGTNRLALIYVDEDGGATRIRSTTSATSPAASPMC